jgi:cytochrome c biogenesis protein CcmG/thiol:disulfide interchange protein DsbE
MSADPLESPATTELAPGGAGVPETLSGESPDSDGPGEVGRPRSMVYLRRTRKALWIAVAVAVPVTMLILVLATRPSAESKTVQSPLLGKPAPAAEGTTVDGQHANLADFRGRWVVVNFFATWCIPCRDEHPDLVRFQDSHRAAGDATILAVVYSDMPSAVRDFRAKEGGDWPMLTDPDGRIALDYGVGGVPESFVVNPDGIIVSKILGGVRSADLERLLAQAEAQAQARAAGGG